MFRKLTRLAAAGGVLFVLMPFAEPVWWGLGLPAHFPLQLSAGALVAALVAIGLRERAAATAFVIVLAFGLFQARDHLPQFATVEAAASDYAVVTLNLDWRNPDLGPAVDWLRRVRADIVVLPEYTPSAARRLDDLQEIYPFRFEAPRESAWGIGLLSRHPIVSGEVIFPGGADSPALDVTIALPDEPVRVVGVHPRPPISARYVAERNAQLAAVAKLVADEERTTLVCGDFNDTPFSTSFRTLLRRSGLVNAATGQGYPATFPVGHMPVWIPIDHCLYRGSLVPVRVQSGPDVGSDHYPLLVDFRR